MIYECFWISPSLSQKRDSIAPVLLSLQEHLQETKIQNSPNSINVGTIKEVRSAFGSKSTYVSDTFIAELKEKKINNIRFLRPGTQCISLCLGSFVVSSTGFDNKKNIKIACYVTRLGGTFQKNFSEDTTLVIANTPLSQTYYQAVRSALPVVNFEWISECYKRLERVVLEEKYKVKCFSNVVFTTTDLSHTAKKECRKLITRNGGELIDIINDSTTFLIADSLCMTKKIETALRAHICIVNTEWIKMCAAASCAVDDYVFNWWHIDGYTKKRIFDGVKFAVEKNTSTPELVEAINCCGGAISDAESANYVVLPLTAKRTRKNYVTSWWVWQCISQGKILSQELSMSFTPIGASLPITELKGVIVFVHESLAKDEKTDVTYLLREAGATVYLNYTDSAKYIVCTKDVNSQFAERMSKQEKHLVNKDWVSQLLKEGRIPEPAFYSVTKGVQKADLRDLCGRIKNVNILMNIQRSESTGIERSTTPVVDPDSVAFSQKKSDSDDQSQDVTYDSRIGLEKPKKSQKGRKIVISSSDEFSESFSDSSSDDPLLKALEE